MANIPQSQADGSDAQKQGAMNVSEPTGNSRGDGLDCAEQIRIR